VLSLELDYLQSTKRMRMYLSRLLRCETDGWVEKGRWDEVVPIYRDQYAKFMESCIESRELVFSSQVERPQLVRFFNRIFLRLVLYVRPNIRLTSFYCQTEEKGNCS
jgi:hypothetical protein